MASAEPDRTVMEAFHYQYHPLAARMREIVEADLGEVRRVEVDMCIPLPAFSDIRYQYPLAGGALMDAGCYALHAARRLGPAEPAVTAARAITLRRDSRIDRAMRVDLAYPGGATGRVRASLWSRIPLSVTVRVNGTAGAMRVTNFVAPQFPHWITVRTARGTHRERVAGPTTYVCQLRAFAAATSGADTNRTPPSDSVATMSLIDAAYLAAGLPLRP
jgi:predicted dehydrogenase